MCFLFKTMYTLKPLNFASFPVELNCTDSNGNKNVEYKANKRHLLKSENLQIQFKIVCFVLQLKSLSLIS